LLRLFGLLITAGLVAAACGRGDAVPPATATVEKSALQERLEFSYGPDLALIIATQAELRPEGELRDEFLLDLERLRLGYRGSGLEDQFQTRMSRFLSSLQAMRWHADGLDPDEIGLIDSVLEVFQWGVYISPQSDWPGTLLSVLIKGSFVSVPSRRGENVLIMAGSPADGLTEATLAYMQEVFPELENFFGAYTEPYLFLALLPDIDGCSTAGGAGVIFLGFGCGSKQIVVHEMAHTFTSSTLPHWFNEGIAEYVAATATDSVDEAYEYAATFLEDADGSGRFRVEAIHNLTNEVGLTDRHAGFVFLKRLVDIIGYDRLSAISMDVRHKENELVLGSAGQEILDRIRAEAPAELLLEVEALIIRSVDASP
jgi:hypothetical protein